jgi:hypothetical protein
MSDKKIILVVVVGALVLLVGGTIVVLLSTASRNSEPVAGNVSAPRTPAPVRTAAAAASPALVTRPAVEDPQRAAKMLAEKLRDLAQRLVKVHDQKLKEEIGILKGYTAFALVDRVDVIRTDSALHPLQGIVVLSETMIRTKPLAGEDRTVTYTLNPTDDGGWESSSASEKVERCLGDDTSREGLMQSIPAAAVRERLAAAAQVKLAPSTRQSARD